MKNKNLKDPLPKNIRGSALVLVIILMSVLLVWLVPTIYLGNTESHMNARHAYRQKALLTAESIVEYGFSELVQRFKTQSALPTDELIQRPLSLPSSFYNLYSGTSLDTTNIELWGSLIPSSKLVYINPDDPANIDDDHIGKMVRAIEVNIYGKATYNLPFSQDSITAYVMEKLQVRDSPLFSNAIFYNMDLELHPGPTMNIHGPVHTNGNAYLQAVNSITFHDSITASGHIYHLYKKTNTVTQNGGVYITDGSGNKKNMKVDGVWLDSTDPDWQSKSQQRWDGHVQDYSHGVPQINPIGTEDYVPDDPSTSDSELENYAYSIIEPVLPEDHPDYKGASVRQEKYAYKAGLKLKVEKNSSGTYEVKAYRYVRSNTNSATSSPVIDSSTKLPKEEEIYLPEGLIGAADDDMVSIAKSNIPDDYYYNSSSGKVEHGMYDHRQNLKLNVVSIDIEKLRYLVDDTYDGSRLASTSLTSKNYEGNNYGDNTSISASDLKTHWTDPSGSISNTYDPIKDWNGIVYVEFPTYSDSSSDPSSGGKRNADGSRVDHIVSGSDENIVLQLINGSSIPYPEYTTQVGLSIATNAPLYIVGNFNADGDSATGDSQGIEENRNIYKDRSGNTRIEPPASVAADSVTLLSNRWNRIIDGQGKNRYYSDDGNTKYRKGTFTEVSTAILTGLKPTIPDASVSGSSSWISGGAHNFPRFLEKWSSTLTIRGALVALFESEVHEDAMPTNFSHYYSPPTRDWGFNENFENGNYPPGTPNVRTYPRVAFKNLTKEEYEAAKTANGI